MAQKELSQEESIQVIQGMIEMAKNKINETGFHFLLWGFLVISASLTQYFMILGGSGDVSNWVWPAMSAVGLPLAFYYEAKRSKREKTHSKFDKLYGFLWLGFGITLLLTMYVSLSNEINPIPFIGLATFVSGSIYRFKPLSLGAIAFWLAAILCTQVCLLNMLLVNSAAIFIGYIIPGLLLWKKFKEGQNV